MFFDRFRERDVDLDGREDCVVVSMSSLISEDRFWNLFPVSTLVEFSFTILLFFILLLFLVVDDDLTGEFLRKLLFLFLLDAFVGVLSRVPEPVDTVTTEGSLEASRRDGCGPIHDAGV